MAADSELLTIFNGPYTDRITTLIDILAFTRDVASLRDRPALILSIEAVLEKLRNCQSDLDRKRAAGGARFDARMTSFSDTVVLSYLVEPGAVSRALAHAAFIGQVLLRGGYLPRGAITVGRLVHSERIIFGEALIEAAIAEKVEVVTPRIALLPKARALLGPEFQADPHFEREFVRDYGEGPFVHILGEEWPFLAQERRDRAANNIAGDPVAEMYEEIRLAIPVRFGLAPHGGARAKIFWVRDYVNGTIDEQGLPGGYKVVLPESGG